MGRIRIEQNTVSRDWHIIYKGKGYFVNFTYSDGQTLALCNRNLWEITDEEGNDAVYGLNREPELGEEDVTRIIDFCQKHWDFDGLEEEGIQPSPPGKLVWEKSA